MYIHEYKSLIVRSYGGENVWQLFVASVLQRLTLMLLWQRAW